eukprot:4884732-Pleurochrysis_carterae.AAC.1
MRDFVGSDNAIQTALVGFFSMRRKRKCTCAHVQACHVTRLAQVARRSTLSACNIHKSLASLPFHRIASSRYERRALIFSIYLPDSLTLFSTL